MKILQVCPHYMPAYVFGGVLRAVHGLSEELVRQGHEVRVVTTSMKSPEEDLAVPLSTPVPLSGLTVYYEPVRFPRYWGYSPALARQLRQQLAWADLVILNFHYQYASFIGGRLCRRAQKPYLVFAHGSLNRHRLTARGRWRKRLYLKLMEGANLRHARHLVYQSEEEAQNSLQPGNSLVLPNGLTAADCAPLPQRFCRPAAAGTDPVLLYLGRLDRGKGLDLLLPAFARFREDCPGARLFLAGGDERGYGRQLQQQVKELGLNEGVEFTGFVDGKEKLALFGRADIFVLPSRSDTMSIAMLEAMAKELPVLITDRVGLHRTIERERCGVVVSCDSAGLTAGMASLADPAARAGMGARGRALVLGHYQWRHVAARLLETIGNID